MLATDVKASTIVTTLLESLVHDRKTDSEGNRYSTSRAHGLIFVLMPNYCRLEGTVDGRPNVSWICTNLDQVERAIVCLFEYRELIKGIVP